MRGVLVLVVLGVGYLLFGGSDSSNGYLLLSWAGIALVIGIIVAVIRTVAQRSS